MYAERGALAKSETTVTPPGVPPNETGVGSYLTAALLKFDNVPYARPTESAPTPSNVNPVLFVVDGREHITNERVTPPSTVVAPVVGVVVVLELTAVAVVADWFVASDPAVPVAKSPRSTTPAPDTFVTCAAPVSNASQSMVVPLAVVLVTSPRQTAETCPDTELLNDSCVHVTPVDATAKVHVDDPATNPK